MSRKKKMVRGRGTVASLATQKTAQQKMSTYMMLMGYNGDYQTSVAKSLTSRIWMRGGRLSRRRCSKLMYLMCSADSATLLSFTVALLKLIWRDNLMLKRRKMEKKLSQKIKKRCNERLRRVRKGVDRDRRVLSLVKKRKGRGRVREVVKAFRMRSLCLSRMRVVMKHRASRRLPKADVGSPMYRLAMAMNILSFRNVYITSEWEFWAICLVQTVCGFWRSIAFADGLSDRLVPVAARYGLYVVTIEFLERLESCFGCSSTARCLGCRVD